MRGILILITQIVGLFFYYYNIGLEPDSRFQIVGKNDPKIGPFLGSISIISATYHIPDPQNA
jgi:hypothetical protein